MTYTFGTKKGMEGSVIFDVTGCSFLLFSLDRGTNELSVCNSEELKRALTIGE